MNKTEAENLIMQAVISAFVNAGFVIQIDNGGEADELLGPFTDGTEIFNNMRQADEDVLRIYTEEGKLRGFVQFVYGNSGWDVIADYTTSLQQYLTEADNLASQIETLIDN